MINYQDIRPLRIYNTKFNLILNPNDKYKNAAVFLLAPNYESSLKLMMNKYAINRRYIKGYYFEPSVSYYIAEGMIYSFEDLVGISEYAEYFDLLNEDATETTNPNNFRNPTKPREKSKVVDGKKIVPTKKTVNMLRDPKSLMRHLRYDMRRPKYNLNKMKLGKNNVGGKVNNPKAIEKNKELTNQGKKKEENRKKRDAWIKKNLKYTSKENSPKGYKPEEDDNESVNECYMVTENVMEVNDNYTQCENLIIVNPLNEAYSNSIRKAIYKDRIKTSTEMTKIFKKVRKDTNNKIKLYNKSLEKYKELNIYYDLSYYNNVYFANRVYEAGQRGINIYAEFLSKQLNNANLDNNGYKYKTLFIPVNDWVTDVDNLDFKKNVNPLSLIIRALRRREAKFLDIFTMDIIFFSDIGYVKANLSDPKLNRNKLINLITKMVKMHVIEDNDEDLEKVEDNNDNVEKVVDSLEKNTKIEINSPPPTKTAKPVEVKSKPAPTVKTNLATQTNISKQQPKSNTKKEKEVPVTKEVKNKNTGEVKVTVVNEPKSKVKKEMEDKIQKDIEKACNNMDKVESMDDLVDYYEQNPIEKKEIVKDIQNIEKMNPNTVKVSNARSRRMETLGNNYGALSIGGQQVSDLLKGSSDYKQIEPTKVDVDSPVEDWKAVTFTNFEKSYNLDSDIALILESFTKDKLYPIGIIDIQVENTSTSEDYINTYTVSIESIHGKRSKLVFDIPILIDDKFMKLKGNKKTMQKQVAPIPVCKIDENNAQITSNYMKVSISQFGTDGKANTDCDSIIRILRNGNLKNITIKEGDNRSFYDFRNIRPIDFIDLSGYFTEINIDNKLIVDFNLHNLKELFPNNPTESDDAYMIGYNIKGNKKEPIYYKYGDDVTFSTKILNELLKFPDAVEKYNSLPSRQTVKCKYSRAKILGVYMPVIILCCFYEGLESILETSKIEYVFKEVRSEIPSEGYNIIKLKDGYIGYKDTYESSMLMNGLNVMRTQDYTYTEMCQRAPYLEWLNENGYGIKVDGLLNFKDLMMDPITVNCCKKYGLPETFIEMLIYSSNLLSDNKYIIHTDMSSRRIRSTELIAGYTYSAIAKAYQDYANQIRHGRIIPFTMKQTAVIDAIMLDPTFSDMPLLNDLQIFEAGNAVSYKGLSGMNNDRSYSLDKRTYDKSMLNIIGMATGFSGNVGVNRQLTIDPNVETQRGFTKSIDPDNTEELSLAKTFTMTEAITPYGVTRNDPIRSAMNFIQTSSHSMRIEKGSPSLVTNGADQALPYLSDNTFAFKAKGVGKVKEVTNEYVLIQYKDGVSDMVDLRPQMLKNSSGGFYTASQLTPTVKVGDTVKTGKIVAYDENMYSDDIGLGDTLSYKLGVLTKLAILNTDEGFEDSGIISETLSEQMASDVVEIRPVTISKNTNVLHIVKKGDPIQEGDPLIVFQDAGDEEYISQLMTNISTDKDAYGVGSIPVKSKVTGIVKDIKYYRSCPLSEMRPTLKRLVSKYEKENGVFEKVALENNVPDSYKYKVEMLPATGKMKKAADSVIIEFYLEYHDKMGIGDKLIYNDAVKGVIKKVIPNGQEPYSEYRPEEKVHSMVSKGSLDARMVTSVRLVGGINKALIELDRSIKEELGIKWKPIDKLGK